jgi:hypothetical protein
VSGREVRDAAARLLAQGLTWPEAVAVADATWLPVAASVETNSTNNPSVPLNEPEKLGRGSNSTPPLRKLLNANQWCRSGSGHKIDAVTLLSERNIRR